jgi:hypothetical protein
MAANAKCCHSSSNTFESPATLRRATVDTMVEMVHVLQFSSCPDFKNV